MSKTAIWWIRQDLRLADSPALQAAMTYGGQVIPLFILDPALLHSDWVAAQRVAFMMAGLRLLDENLRARGSRLLVRNGRPEQVISQLLDEVNHEHGETAVFAVEAVSPYGKARDKRVAAVAPLRLLPGVTIHPPSLVTKKDGTPYTVFTPFSKAWQRLTPPERTELLPVPDSIPTPARLAGDRLPETSPLTIPFPAGEGEARRRLADFVRGADAPIYRYGSQRDQMSLDGTAQLSPYLRFGMISARETAVAAREAMAAAPTPEARVNAQAWQNELIWRDFYISILVNFPHVRRRNFRSKYDTIAWDNNRAHFAAWCNGTTGYPVVDAAMRQLSATGWMHNRARMITASFLVKSLLVDWRWGEKWFMQHLLDGDPAANNGGWQWTAGTGTDAAPYFRIFNPTTQGKRYDPDGVYIRRWLPELAQVSGRFIHEPHKMTAAMQQEANCLIGRDYPAPIVDHQQARQRTLAAYKLASSAK